MNVSGCLCRTGEFWWGHEACRSRRRTKHGKWLSGSQRIEAASKNSPKVHIRFTGIDEAGLDSRQHGLNTERWRISCSTLPAAFCWSVSESRKRKQSRWNSTPPRYWTLGRAPSRLGNYAAALRLGFGIQIASASYAGQVNSPIDRADRNFSTLAAARRTGRNPIFFFSISCLVL